MSKSKEEILNGHIMSNNLLSVSNAFSKGAKRTDVYNVAINAMEQYATQQTAALEKEVERLKAALLNIVTLSKDCMNGNRRTQGIIEINGSAIKALNKQ